MPIAKIKDKIDRLKTPRVESSSTDERDALIKKLEAELTEQRDITAELRREISALGFQNETLETSYSKQLDDAREHQTAAEEALAELQTELDEVGSGEDILSQLTEARADLETVTAERDRLRDRIRVPEKGKRVAAVPGPTDAAAEIDAFSIDELMEDAVWAQEQAHIDKQNAREAANAAALAEMTAEEMVPPGLVFPDKPEDSSD